MGRSLLYWQLKAKKILLLLIFYPISMKLLMYLDEHLVDSVHIDYRKVTQPGYLGGVKRGLRVKHRLGIGQAHAKPRFLVELITYAGKAEKQVFQTMELSKAERLDHSGVLLFFRELKTTALPFPRHFLFRCCGHHRGKLYRLPGLLFPRFPCQQRQALFQTFCRLCFHLDCCDRHPGFRRFLYLLALLYFLVNE